MIEFLKLKPWQVFVFIILIPILLIPTFEGHLMSPQTEHSLFLFFLAICPLLMTISFWQYAVITILHSVLPKQADFNYRKFQRVNLARWGALIGIVILLYQCSVEYDTVLLIVLALLTMLFIVCNSQITTMVKVLIVSVEKGREAQSSDTYGLSLVMRVILIGIPVIHSRVRRLVLKHF